MYPFCVIGHIYVFLSFKRSELDGNKLSSVRALHAGTGVGLVRTHDCAYCSSNAFLSC